MRGGKWEIEVLVDGEPQPEHLIEDRTVVEAMPGAKFEVRVTVCGRVLCSSRAISAPARAPYLPLHAVCSARSLIPPSQYHGALICRFDCCGGSIIVMPSTVWLDPHRLMR